MNRYKIEESVSGEVMIVKAKTVKLAVKRLIDFLPINEKNASWNYDIAVFPIKATRK